MRLLTTLLFIGLATFSKADTLDFVHIYHNGRAVLKTNQTNSNEQITITASLGDTLVFRAFTDWSLLQDASVTIKDPAGAYSRTITRYPNNLAGAEFILVVDEKLLNQTVQCNLQYTSEGSFEPWSFAILSVKEVE